MASKRSCIIDGYTQPTIPIRLPNGTPTFLNIGGKVHVRLLVMAGNSTVRIGGA